MPPNQLTTDGAILYITTLPLEKVCQPTLFFLAVVKVQCQHVPEMMPQEYEPCYWHGEKYLFSRLFFPLRMDQITPKTIKKNSNLYATY